MIALRKAELMDAEIITKNRIAAYNKDTRDFGSGTDGGPPEYDSIEATIEGISSKENLYYLIILNNEIIGSFWLGKKDKNHYELEDFVINPNYQNLGYGKEAMKLMEETHPEITTWTLGTPKYSTKNRHLYEKMGYEEVGNSEDDFLVFYKKEK